MKKYLPASMLCALLTVPCVADAAPQGLIKTNDGYKVTYQYDDKPAPKDWYFGGKFAANFASFDETRYVDGEYTGNGDDKQTHSGAMQLGGSIFAGNKISDNWRIEAEVGYTGKYSDFGKGVEFSLATPYAEFNVNYNTAEEKWGWLYIGGGVGAAFAHTTITGDDVFLAGGENGTRVSPLFAAMLGYRAHIADNWFVDVGYKFMTFQGSDHTRQFIDGSAVVHDFTDKIDWVMNHAITLGLAWEF
ncbi:MAG: outer membrane beta-barrel protein [Rickettsiales bacterium]|jgi:opacity protein-like surface antigen|nr:outer membrane beta-barrel protein [Rickettsiales bacterium]